MEDEFTPRMSNPFTSKNTTHAWSAVGLVQSYKGAGSGSLQAVAVDVA